MSSESPRMPVGDDPIATARAAAQQAGFSANVNFQNQSFDYGEQVTRKAADDDTFARVGSVIQQTNQAQYDQVVQLMNDTASAMQNEKDALDSASDHLAHGQKEYETAEDMPDDPMMPKIGQYNLAQQHFESAQNALDQADNLAGQIDGYLFLVEGILNQYG